MPSVLTAIAVVAGLSALLAAVLIVADAVLLNYGRCTIAINDDDERVVQGGSSLLASLMENEIFIPSACGGRGSCGLCKVKVLEGGGPLLPTEAPHLTQDEIRDGIRLSCQVKVRSDMRIEVSDEILNLQQYEARVESLTDLNYDTKLVVLKLLDPPEMEFRPGQYIQLETPPYGKTPEPVYRAYSIASSATAKGSLSLVIRRVPNGICTTYVFEMMREGDRATINGPYGDFYLRDTDAEIIFVAGASGIAPIWSMLHQMAEKGITRKATFFYGANELKDLYLVEEMREFEQKVDGFTFIPCVARPAAEDGWEGEVGLVTAVIDKHVAGCSPQEVYLCGSPAMIDAVMKLLEAKGLAADRAFYDKFA